MPDRKKTKEQLSAELAQLRRSEEQYRQLLDEMTDGHCITRSQYILFANTRLAQMLGCSVDQLVGQSWMDFIEPDMANYIENNAMADLPWPMEVQVWRTDGQCITVEVNAHPTTFDGQIAEFVIVRDISERKQIETLLRIEHDLSVALSATASLNEALCMCLEAALAASNLDSGAIYLVDHPSGDVHLVYHQGLSTDFIANAGFFKADSPQAQLVQAGQPVYTRFSSLRNISTETRQREQLKVVAIIPIHHQENVIGCLNVASHSADDIPQPARDALETIASQIGSAIARLRAEKALRESEERKYRSIVEHSTDGIVLTDEQGLIIEWNPGQERITGLSKTEVLGQSLWEIEFRLLPPDQQSHFTRKRLQASICEFLQSGQRQRPSFLWEQEIVHRDGTRRTMQLAIFPIQTEKSFMAGAITRDITEQKQAEQHLQLLSSAVEQSSEGIAVADLEGNLLFVNQAFAGLHGYTPEQTIGKHLSIFHSHDQLAAVTAANEQIRTTGRFSGEIGHMRSDGTIFPGLMHNSLLRDETGAPVAMIRTLRDITHIKQTEEDLLRRNWELKLLNESIQTFVSTLDLDQVLIMVLDKMQQLIGPYTCSAWLIDTTTKELVCKQMSGPHSERIRGRRLVWGTGTVGWVAQHRQSIIVPDAQADPRYCHDLYGQLGLTPRSVIGVPLTTTTGVIGVLSAVDMEPDRFQPSDLVVLEPLAATAAMAIENAQLFEQVQRDAKTQAALLREVNHRVKNNLSTIIGMLYAARRYAAKKELPVYRSIMNDLVNRVQGLATVHNMLSASHWTPLCLSELCTQIIQSAVQGLPLNKRMTVDVSPSPVRVSAKQASHLALIINELATNAVKYALNHRETARITVWVQQQADTVQLVFQDDGPGYPDAVLGLETHNVGFNLIKNIVWQNLGGSLNLENVRGAKTTIRFKLHPEMESEQ